MLGWILYFFVELELLDHMDIGLCTTSWGISRTQERGNSDLDPNAKRQVVHSPLNGWSRGELRQIMTLGGNCEVAESVLQSCQCRGNGDNITCTTQADMPRYLAD